MSEYTTILFEVKGPVCTITLNRPDKYNAINREMAAELLDAFQKVRDIPEVAWSSWPAAGKAFCTGGDLSIFPSLAEHQASPSTGWPMMVMESARPSNFAKRWSLPR